jgi:hypothetical protein
LRFICVEDLLLLIQMTEGGISRVVNHLLHARFPRSSRGNPLQKKYFNHN